MPAHPVGFDITPHVDWSEQVINSVVTITMLMLALSGWAAYFGLDKDALAVDALRIAGPLLVGSIIGYYYGRPTTGTGSESRG